MANFFILLAASEVKSKMEEYINDVESQIGTTEEKEYEEIIMVDDTQPLKKEMVGGWFTKSEFEGKETLIKPVALGKRGSRNVLFFESDNQSFKVGITVPNKNKLIDLLGSDVSKWHEKTVTVKGFPDSWNIKGEEKTGTRLEFS